MIEFKAPEISDVSWIKEIVYKSGIRCADYSFCTMFAWGGHSEEYTPFVAKLGDRMLSKMDIQGTMYYAYPIGSGDIAPAMYALREDAAKNSIPFRMSNITSELLPEVKDFFGDTPEVYLDEKFSDYVYTAEKLVSLSGKKLHSKRNHMYRFMDQNEGWQFEEITRENLDECGEMAFSWFRRNAAERGGDFDGEMHALGKVFDNYFDMGLDGGLIRTSDGIVAFTIGEPLCEDTFVSHFEKARSDINGAYTIINQQFAEFITNKYPNVVYINREEDMGIESLKKAKQSYHPAFLVDKYTVVWK